MHIMRIRYIMHITHIMRTMHIMRAMHVRNIILTYITRISYIYNVLLQHQISTGSFKEPELDSLFLSLTLSLYHLSSLSLSL